MYDVETTYFIQIWGEMSIWFENTFLVMQASALENSLLGQIWPKMSIFSQKHIFGRARL